MHQKPTKTCITSAEFGRLYSDYNPRFTEVAYRYVRDRGIAEDLVSDSFMAFWEERDRLPEDVNAPAYVLTIVKNKCLNHLKVRLLHLQIEKKLHSTPAAADPVRHSVIGGLRSRHAVRGGDADDARPRRQPDAGCRMPELTRRIFEGSRYENKSYKELAQELNIAFTHVNFEIRRALKILREEFKDYIFALIILLAVSNLI